MNYWFTADYHLGHANIIKYCNRPFKDLNHMNKTIIRNHNSRVKANDIVFHLGDFCFKNTGIQWEQQLNGKIIYLKGNHDNSTKTIIHGILIEYCNHKVYCVHKPEHYNPDYKINFVGHIHDHWVVKRKEQTILINVGVDVHKFMPITFQEAIRHRKQAISGI